MVAASSMNRTSEQDRLQDFGDSFSLSNHHVTKNLSNLLSDEGRNSQLKPSKKNHSCISISESKQRVQEQRWKRFNENKSWNNNSSLKANMSFDNDIWDAINAEDRERVGTKAIDKMDSARNLRRPSFKMGTHTNGDVSEDDVVSFENFGHPT